MTEIDRIRDQFRRSLDGNAWHGPAIAELLTEVTAEAASARPVTSAHSIWELALHIGAWQHAAVRMLRGEAVHLSDAEDWPPAGEGELEWQLAVAHVRRTHADLDASMGMLDDSRLNDPIPARDYDTYFLLHGVIQHNLYHAGQIAMLKKALTPTLQPR
jgi:uncharacterized damage-inducible protein DinB